ncbi:MAG: hypothetical protein JXB47_09475 [Anaerolineae bacterium]|nr:hypothetical protein [Anaerolineae bacterium]
MEAASQNIERLIDELTTDDQMATRPKITREMQELSAASGLLTRDVGENPPSHQS